MNAKLHKLVENLEAARMAQVDRLADCDLATAGSDIRSLADIQTALTAVREVVGANEPSLGHGSETTSA